MVTFKIQSPFLFNDLKHHVKTQLNFINHAKLENLRSEVVKDYMLKIGNSMIDLYYGNLSVLDICKEITEILKTENHYKKDEYIRFLNSVGKKYRKINLSDGSGWTLLIGREEERYIHIHPSRASKHTIRVRAIALRTALMLLIYKEMSDLESKLVPVVNDIRLNCLGESPIKNESYTKGLRRVLKVFANASGEHKLL